MSGPKPLPLPEPVARWADHRRAAGRPATTITTQTRYVAGLAKVHDLDTVTAEQIVEWLVSHRHWGNAALKSANSALRVYFRWAQRTGRRPDDPAALLDPVKAPPPCPRPVPEDVLERVLAAADDPDTHLMVLLAAYAGLRRAEIAGLHSDDRDGDLLRVRGKGGRTRLVPVSGELLRQLSERPPGWVFPGRTPGRHVCPDMVGKRLSRLLPAGFSGHKLRHRYATRVHAGSRDLLALQSLLGHASPETTRRYVLSDLDQLRAAAAAAL